MGDFPIDEWTESGDIPVLASDPVYYFAAYFTRLEELVNDIELTFDHVRFCTLEWYFLNGNDTHQRWVMETVVQLRAQGVLMTTGEVATLTGYSIGAVANWQEPGFLMHIQVGRPLNRYFLALDVHRAKQILDRLTSYEAAEILGCLKNYVDKLASTGRLNGVLTPSGWRFTKSAVLYQKKRRTLPEDKVLLSVAAQMLDVSYNVIKDWAKKGCVPYVKTPKGRVVEVAYIENMIAQRTMLRGDFDWINAAVDDRRYTFQQAARVLGVTDMTVAAWVNRDLLPYYNHAPVGLSPERYCLATYVDALKQYGDSTARSASMKLAIEYKEYQRRWAQQ